MLGQTFKKWSSYQTGISAFGIPFRKHAIKFLQNFRIDFESIRRNVSSDLQKEISIAGAKLHLLEFLFLSMPSNLFKISESISNRFSEMLGQTRNLHSRGNTSVFETSFCKHVIRFLQNFRIDFESIHRNVRSELQKEVYIWGAKLHLLESLFVNMPSNFFKISESISNGFTEMLGQNFKKWSS